MQKYTMKKHVARLKTMFRRVERYGYSLKNMCPSALNFGSEEDPQNEWSSDNDPCAVCRAFVGIAVTNSVGCPCLVYGKELAKEITNSNIRDYEAGDLQFPEWE